MTVKCLYKKFNILSIISFLLAGLCLVQNSFSTPISLEEKRAIISAIGEGFRDKFMYIDGNPEYHDHNEVAEAWFTFVSRVNVLNALDKEGFEKKIKFILNDIFCSHVTLWFHPSAEEAIDILNRELSKHLGEPGFRFEPRQGAFGLYKVTFVDLEGMAYKKGIREGHLFYLPIVKNDTGKYDTRTYVKMIKEDCSSLPKITFIGDKLPMVQLEVRVKNPVHPHRARDEYAQKVYELGNKRDIPLCIKSFHKDYEREYVEGALEYAANELGQIIIDLRNNRGGARRNCNHFLSYFLEPHAIYAVKPDRIIWDAFRMTGEYTEVVKHCQHQRDRLNNEFGKVFFNYIIAQKRKDLCFVASDSNLKFKGKVAILINEKTACAAELAAATLRSFLGPTRCVIIGKRSAGKALGTQESNKIRITEKCFMTYPFCDVLLPSGVRIEGRGIIPDIEVSDTKECLREARKWFKDPSTVTPRENLNDGTYHSLTDKISPEKLKMKQEVRTISLE